MARTTGRRRADPDQLEAFISNAGLSYKTLAKSFCFTCPRCRKPDKLWLYRDASSFICFYCAEESGFKGAPEFALKELTGRSLGDVRRALYGADVPAAGESLFLDLGAEDCSEDEELDIGLEFAPDLVWPIDHLPLNHRDSAPGATYLVRRGIPIDIAMEYDIRWSTEKKRVCFPVFVGERLVGWQGRIIGPETFVLKTDDGEVTRARMKVLSTPDIPRDRVVMFQNRLKDSDVAVLCEGPVDALKAHYVGGNIATMGKAVSDKQIEVIRRSGVKLVYIALDPDACLGLTQLGDRLDAAGLETKLVEIPDGYKDLGEMPLDEATTAILAAEPLKRDRMHVFFNFDKN